MHADYIMIDLHADRRAVQQYHLAGWFHYLAEYEIVDGRLFRLRRRVRERDACTWLFGVDGRVDSEGRCPGHPADAGASAMKLLKVTYNCGRWVASQNLLNTTLASARLHNFLRNPRTDGCGLNGNTLDANVPAWITQQVVRGLREIDTIVAAISFRQLKAVETCKSPVFSYQSGRGVGENFQEFSPCQNHGRYLAFCSSVPFVRLSSATEPSISLTSTKKKSAEKRTARRRFFFASTFQFVNCCFSEMP